jgi:hypothetical protein
VWVRRADVLDAQPFDEELAQLEDTRDELLDRVRECRVTLRECPVELPHRCDA